MTFTVAFPLAYQCVVTEARKKWLAGGEYINNIPNLAIILKSKFMWASFYAIDDFSACARNFSLAHF